LRGGRGKTTPAGFSLKVEERGGGGKGIGCWGPLEGRAGVLIING